MSYITKNPFFLICGCIFLILLFSLFGKHIPSDKLNEAQEAYQAGEKAANVQERNQAFNRSLELFLELEKEHGPSSGDGKLYFNIGNAFFQLEEYPKALLYFYKAKSLRPRDQKIDAHIDLAKQKLGILQKESPAAFENLFYFHNRLSLPERIQLFACLWVLTFLLASWFIWSSKKFVFGAMVISAGISCLMLFSLLYTHYLTPLEGVIVKSTLLYRDAGQYYSTVSKDPLLSGNRARVLYVNPTGEWLKIEMPDGAVGYVSSDAIRII